MLVTTTCTETVSLLRTLVFGADGACIDLGIGSILGLAAALVGGVLLLKLVGILILGLLFRRSQRRARAPGPETAATPPPNARGRIGVTTEDGGPIRSS